MKQVQNLLFKKWLTLLSKPFLRLIYFILTCVVLLVAVYFVFRIDPSRNPLAPACSFYYFTGFYCPACGMTRALHHAMHGRFGAAFSYNLLWPIIIFFIAVSIFLWFFYILTGKNPFHAVNRFLTFPATLAWIIVVTLIAFWILRNIPVYPFTFLAP